MKINSLIEHYLRFAKDFSKQKEASFSHFKNSKVYKTYFISIGAFVLLSICPFIIEFIFTGIIRILATLAIFVLLLINISYIRKFDRGLDVLMVRHVQERQNQSYKMYLEFLKTEYSIRRSNELQVLTTLIKEDTVKKYSFLSVDLQLYSFILTLFVSWFTFSSLENKNVWFTFFILLFVLILISILIYRSIRNISVYSKRELRHELCKILDEIHLTLLIQENNQDSPSPNSVKSFSKTIKKAKRYRHF
ncbi:hypothetical protein [Exiguobacterium alkaliphilum]|uniref:hypothetical protein n=1 Tax=Exiguobacterium alkaliphilum TaxID=1428684 RepID=UPI001BA895D8|nr:hypothetical protein [Exiguobacterium alkaliphilum]QUE88020.1 hypothetical protein KB235_15435 [Exiguobacterium alkaliphilum]